jgi:gamma-glutamyltranspeptidase/glutathione hydrolase
MHVMAEAMALAFADRNWYVADPERVAVPPGLLDPGYISERRRLIDPARPMAKAYPGTPPAATKLALGDDNTVEVAGTTHLSIIDAAGNAVSMTSSIEAGFGSRLWAAGFLLNNQLTDFAFRPVDREKRAVANRVEGGKRPRSSMAPTIVLDETGLPVIVTGSPGGSRIIPYVLKSLVALIDWKLEPQQAAALTNFGNRGSGLEIEMPLTAGDGFAGFLSHAEQTDRALRYAIGLRPHGHTATFDEMTSGLHIIVRRRDGRLAAGVDPRREGAAMGD